MQEKMFSQQKRSTVHWLLAFYSTHRSICRIVTNQTNLLEVPTVRGRFRTLCFCTAGIVLLAALYLCAGGCGGTFEKSSDTLY